jgi:hypothetical protein
MTQKFANAARAYLASSVTNSATTVTIGGGGSLFPAISTPDFSRAVLQDANGIEVVLITAHTAGSNSFTVTRGQEGTTARSFAAGSVFGIRMTAADGDTFVAKQDTLLSGTNIKTVNGASLLGSGDLVITQNVQVISTNTTAVRSRLYVLTASLTLTLPASPAAGDWVAFSNRSGTPTPVIARNGQPIMGLAEDMTLDNVNHFGVLVFSDSTRGWIFN